MADFFITGLKNYDITVISSDQINEKIDKILDFEYKWYSWKHVDFWNKNLTKLKEYKKELKDMILKINAYIKESNYEITGNYPFPSYLRESTKPRY